MTVSEFAHSKAQLLITAVTTRRYYWQCALLIIVAEFFLCQFIIRFVPYTEIDWVTYMQQVECVLNGTRDYRLISGDTGPLPYPAGHVWVYTLLHWLTEGGKSLRKAQFIFGAIYLFTLAAVFAIYAKTPRVPVYALAFACFAAYRVHSIYVLRLFNDGVAAALLYAAVALFVRDRWSLGCLLFSLGVGVKMNVLLFAPALLYCLIERRGVVGAAYNIAFCAFVQLLMGYPFLSTHPWSYVQRSFNLGRSFLFEWTVNWRFLPEEVFLDRRFHAALLIAHLSFLAVFAYVCWFRGSDRLSRKPLHRNYFREGSQLPLQAEDVVFALFTANFIGVALARTLHYQFYVWYYHTIPFLLWSTPYPNMIRFLLMMCLEYSWNTYPSTELSSGLLTACHCIILVGLLASRKSHRKSNSQMD